MGRDRSGRQLRVDVRPLDINERYKEAVKKGNEMLGEKGIQGVTLDDLSSPQRDANERLKARLLSYDVLRQCIVFPNTQQNVFISVLDGMATQKPVYDVK